MISDWRLAVRIRKRSRRGSSVNFRPVGALDGPRSPALAPSSPPAAIERSVWLAVLPTVLRQPIRETRFDLRHHPDEARPTPCV